MTCSDRANYHAREHLHPNALVAALPISDIMSSQVKYAVFIR